MSVTVRIPTPLRTLTGGKDEVSAKGGTVGEVIDDLEESYPGIKDRLCDTKGVRRFVNIYANEEDIRFLDNLQTKVSDGDSLSIVPAIAGGRTGIATRERGPFGRGPRRRRAGIPRHRTGG